MAYTPTVPNTQIAQTYPASLVQYMRLDLQPNSANGSGGYLKKDSLIVGIWTEGTPTVTYADENGTAFAKAPVAGDFLPSYAQIAVTNGTASPAVYVIAFIQPAWDNFPDMPDPSVN